MQPLEIILKLDSPSLRTCSLLRPSLPSMRHWLRHGQWSRVVRELVWRMHRPQLEPSKRQTVEQVSRYFQDHIAHIDYQKFSQMEFPLGSGMVESACKWLIQQRFKGVGMRWSEEGFNHLLHLRLAWANGRFDEIFAENTAAISIHPLNR